jgi:hypothetical protein
MEQQTRNESIITIETGARCELYEVDIPFLDSIQLTTSFKNIVKFAYKNSNGITWKRVIQTFGTHYVERTTFGGRSVYQYKIKTENLQGFLNDYNKKFHHF